MLKQAVQEAPNEVITLIKNFPKQPNKGKRLDVLFKKLDAGLRNK